MKFIKRAFLTIIFLTAVGLLFRGYFYRHLVTYRSIGVRANYPATDKKLTDYIDENMDQATQPDIEHAVKISLSITSRRLYFTTGQNDNDPNQLISSRAAHCVGYASFFSTTCNYLLKKYNLDDQWTAQPRIGELYFWGTNIHKYVNGSFFKDHDFVTIENKTTGELFAVDPTVKDYLYIDFIKYSK